MTEQLLFDDTQLNTNQKIVNAIRKRLVITEGYCPCDQGETPKEDTKCPCKKYREEHYCCCQLYIPKSLKLFPLSKLNKKMSLGEVLNILIDNNYEGVINDLTLAPNIEYSLDDLFTVWDNLKQCL